MSSTPVEPVHGHPDHISESQIEIIALTVVFHFLAIVSVVGRFIARYFTPGTRLWWDDWTILVSSLIASAYLVLLTLAQTVGGAGYHIDTYSRDQLVTYLKLTLAGTTIYNFTIVFSKASLLFLYERIFSVERRLYIWIQIMKGLLVAYLISGVGTLIFGTNPVEAQWKYWIPHTTINQTASYVVFGIANLLFDVIILAIPQSKVWKLNQTLKRRLSLSLVFLLGGFVCISTIVRLTSLATINPADLPYSLQWPAIWTSIEIYLSIICACLPTVPSAITVFVKKQKKPHNNSRGPGDPANADSTYLRLGGSGERGNQLAAADSSRLQAYKKSVGREEEREYVETVSLQQVPPVHTGHDSQV
ncbi:hypothetical protein F5Y10DRAFT_89233 [Nemania abortiva]|nr:hypothetical protein F5Y10DRAFT_89233 [Nemania abortiva]